MHVANLSSTTQTYSIPNKEDFERALQLTTLPVRPTIIETHPTSHKIPLEHTPRTAAPPRHVCGRAGGVRPAAAAAPAGTRSTASRPRGAPAAPAAGTTSGTAAYR